MTDRAPVSIPGTIPDRHGSNGLPGRPVARPGFPPRGLPSPTGRFVANDILPFDRASVGVPDAVAAVTDARMMGPTG